MINIIFDITFILYLNKTIYENYYTQYEYTLKITTLSNYELNILEFFEKYKLPDK